MDEALIPIHLSPEEYQAKRERLESQLKRWKVKELVLRFQMRSVTLRIERIKASMEELDLAHHGGLVSPSEARPRQLSDAERILQRFRSTYAMVDEIRRTADPSYEGEAPP